MKENENLYGPHDIEGGTFPQSAFPLPGLTEAGINNEYLDRILLILKRLENMEAFVAMDDERRKEYEQKRTADIESLGKVATDLSDLSEKTFTADKNIDDMLQEMKEVKKGVPVKFPNDFKDYWENLPEKLSIKFLNLADKSLSGKLNDFQEKLHTMTSSYEEVSKGCDTKLSDIKSVLASIDGKIIFSAHAFWGMMTAFFVVAIFGIIGWWNFQSLPENKNLLSFLGIAVIFNFVFEAIKTVLLKMDKDYKVDSQNGIVKMSFGQLLYMILMEAVFTVYATWWIVDGDRLPLLKWLLPVAFLTNFWWFLLKYIIKGLFQRS